MTRSINFVLLLSGCAFAFVSAQVFTGSPQRQVEVFVNVYNHPKTGFSCADKAPGQYYADPATKCAVYYVCIANPTGTLSPQSFACPNGTIFSQATRVCKPHEEVYCPLATRYYDNVQGLIDQKGEIDLPPLPIPVQPIQPVVHQPRRQSAPRTKPQPAPQPQPQPQQPPALLQSPPAPQPKPAQPASSLFNSNSRFRNTRTFSAPATTSTTTSAPVPAAAGPESRSPADYEYDYNDYGNETGIANAASSLHAQIIENIAEAIAKESKDNTEKSGEESAAAEKAVSRRKRQSEPWMLSRRKGQLMEALGDLMSLSGDDAQSTATTATGTTASFTCEDKIAGVAYADIQSGCSKFYVCVTVAKAKLWSYHLNCDQGKRFNQALGMCDNHHSDKNCARSERYYAYNKWHKASKKHFLDSAKKMSAQQ